MIELALLAGSDYTEGINGIGIVTAMEIVAEFDSLLKFKEWYNSEMDSTSDLKDANDNQLRRRQLKRRLRNAKVELKEDFPPSMVVEAYMFPLVDESLEPFEWSPFDVEKLRQYALDYFGWTKELVDQYLDTASSYEEQATLDSFLIDTRATTSSASKRLSNCIQQLKRNTVGSIK